VIRCIDRGGSSWEALLSLNRDRPPSRAVRRAVFYCRPGSRSAASMMLDIPRTMTSLGDREFAVAGPRVWNSLPPVILDPSFSLSVFGKLLKTYLFV